MNWSDVIKAVLLIVVDLIMGAMSRNEEETKRRINNAKEVTKAVKGNDRSALITALSNRRRLRES